MGKRLFDFHCRACDTTYEKLTTETASTVCPNCNSNDTERILSATSFKVTGAGAYTNKMKV